MNAVSNSRITRCLAAIAALVLVTALCASSATGAGAAALPPLQVLQPGFVGVIVDDMPVNLVFVGYRPGTGPRDINLAALGAQLAGSAVSIVRSPIDVYGTIRLAHVASLLDYRPI